MTTKESGLAKSGARARNRRSTATASGPVMRTQAPMRKFWRLRLYVAGQTPKSIRAFANLKALCEQHLPGKYDIEVVDLMEKPQLARGDQIVAIPTLVRKLPQPVRKIIGDLSNEVRVLVGLDLREPGEKEFRVQNA